MNVTTLFTLIIYLALYQSYAYAVDSKYILVDSPAGKILGVQGAGSQVAVFKGIPYALPPIGSLRWKGPANYPKWEGERLAVNFSAACSQPGPTNKSSTSLKFYRPAEQTSEDCLYLNIWSPVVYKKTRGDELLPVMVWIHGGGFKWGSSSLELYDGEALSKQGVIIVSFNYRLGVFGYLSHPELTVESKLNSSGNYGTLDQIAALEWVKKNILSFGGDPNNITIFGESSGGTSISHLMVATSQRDLFHKAIIQSATLPPMRMLKKEIFGLPSAESEGVALQKVMGVDSISAMRKISAIDILSAAERLPYLIDPGPVIDGWLFDQQIFDAFSQSRQKKIPLIVGFTADEGSLYYLEGGDSFASRIPCCKKKYRRMIEERYGDLSDIYLKVYPDSDLYQAVVFPIRDAIFGWAAHYFANANSSVDRHTYFYYFDHPPPWALKTKWGAFHLSDVIYSFNNVSRNPKYSHNWPDLNPTKMDYAMGQLISEYWVTFAKNGNPNREGLPAWDGYSENDQRYITFKDGEGVPLKGFFSKRYALHEEIFLRRRQCGVSTWWFNNVGLLAPMKNKVRECLPVQDELNNEK